LAKVSRFLMLEIEWPEPDHLPMPPEPVVDKPATHREAEKLEHRPG
jgi:hypothetical protein